MEFRGMGGRLGRWRYKVDVWDVWARQARLRVWRWCEAVGRAVSRFCRQNCFSDPNTHIARHTVCTE